MNAATGQKIGMGGVGGGVTGVGGSAGVTGVGGITGVGGLSVASSTISGSGVSGVGLSALNDHNKGLLNFNIQGTNGKSSF
jgi:hypothetical protein